MNASRNNNSKTKEELIGELKKQQEKNSQIQKELTERQKELNAVYQISSFMENDNWSLTDILQQTVSIIPPSWQYPENTSARIILGKKEYKTSNFEISEWKQSETIFINNQPVGEIEVFLVGENPDKLKKLFIKEEQYLLKVIAERIGKIILRKQTEKKLKESESRYQLIVKNVSDAIWVYNLTLEKFTFVSPSVKNLTGFTPEEAVKKTLAETVSSKHHKHLFSLINEGVARFKRDNNSRTILSDVQLVCKDGSLVWIEFSAYFKKNKKDEIEAFGVSRYIEQRKRAEFKLKNKEKNLRSVLDNLQDAYFQADLSGKFSFVNPAAVRMFGYTSVSEMLGMPANKIYADSKDREMFLNKLSEKGSFNDITIQGIRKDKTLIWVSVNGQLLTDDKGNTTGTEGVLRDVTGKILAKNRAEQQRIQFNSALEISGLGYFIGTLTEIEFMDDRAKSILGMPNEKPKDESYQEIWLNSLHEDDRGDVLAAIKETAEGKRRTATMTYRYHHGNKGQIWIKHNTEVLQRDVKKRILKRFCVVQDISELKRKENELTAAKEKAEESDSRLTLAVDSGKLGIWDWNVQENRMIWNNRMYDLYGIDKNSFSHDNESWVNGLHPDDKERTIEESNAALKNKKKFSMSFRIVRPDKTVVHIIADGMVIRDKNGDPIRMLGINRDITELVKYEEDLIKAKEKAEESDRLKSAFLSNMSHEIRTPMNGILGFLQLLEQPDLNDVDKHTFQEIVKKSAERLMNTINDIVEISKIEIGDIKLKFANVDVSEFMEFYSGFFRLQAEEKGLSLKITKQVTGSSAIIKTDKNKLDGIMINLIGNAIKFTSKGSIQIGNYVENGRMYFFVSDTGKGIPEDKLEIIFDRFVQAELGKTRDYEGSGLGLSIVKAYLDAMGGHIEVKSEPGKGSTFVFSVPSVPGNPEPEKIKLKNAPVGGRKVYSLLIAEDDEVNYYFLETILSKEYSILHAKSGPEAVELFMNNPEIALILMDIKMPGEYDGLEATRKIRDVNKHVPIIAQTAYSLEADKIMALEAGCTDYISKPYEPALLKELIRQHCIVDE